jgi:ATP-binding cassette, sub-family E, member 1
MKKKNGNFTLNIKAGTFCDSQIIILLGENGTGKTTLIKILSGIDPEWKYLVNYIFFFGIKIEISYQLKLPKLVVSYKPQSIEPKFEGKVKLLLNKMFKNAEIDPSFKTDVLEKLKIKDFYHNEVKNLSGYYT